MFSSKPILLSELPQPDFTLLDELETEEEDVPGYVMNTDAGLPYISIDQLAKKLESGKIVKIFDCRFN